MDSLHSLLDATGKPPSSPEMIKTRRSLTSGNVSDLLKFNSWEGK